MEPQRHDGTTSKKKAAMEEAVEALRQKNENAECVPDENLRKVEQAIESADAGRLTAMAPEYWERLRQVVRDTAADQSTTN